MFADVLVIESCWMFVRIADDHINCGPYIWIRKNL